MDFSSPDIEATRDRLIARFGARVAPWWERLPEALALLSGRWELDVAEPLGQGHTSLVVRCRRIDGRAAILKLTPDPEIARAEATALRTWAASGRVPLVWGHDGAIGALLLEAMPHETPLSDGGAEVGLPRVADLLRDLHRSEVAPALAGGVISLADRVDFVFGHWVERHRRSAGAVRAVPVACFEQGYALARSLAADETAPVLLHGDLHPGNVLDGGEGRGLVAIDPRPCVGEPAFDAVDWVFWTADGASSWEARSQELASAIGVDHERLWHWCTAFAAIVAAGKVSRDGESDDVHALVALAR